MKNHYQLAIERSSGNLVDTDWKVGLARWVKSTTRLSNRSLTDRLRMGVPDTVSRYCSECPEERRAHLRFDASTV